SPEVDNAIGNGDVQSRGLQPRIFPEPCHDAAAQGGIARCDFIEAGGDDCTHEVPAADDAHKLSRPRHGHALDAMFFHQGGDAADRSLLVDRHDIAAHDVADIHAVAF